MRTVSSCAGAIVTAAITALASGAYAQDTKFSLPNVTVTAPAAPVEPPYMRDPWKAYGRNPYFGRYRVEEDKFVEVPCTATRIAVGASGKCLQGYRLTPSGSGSSSDNTNPCDMALDVVIDTAGKLAIEADILVFDPYKVNANGSVPKWCYVHGYTGYDQEDFQDMNQVTRRGSNWHNLQINDMQDQWHAGDRLRSSRCNRRATPVQALRQRAAQGNPEDEFQLGKSYEFEFGFGKNEPIVKVDPIGAAKWYGRAAKHGSNAAAENLGLMYESGRMIPQDYKKAADLYLLAAKRGDEWSQNAVAGLYEDGKGVPQNYTAAVYWYQKSAEQGDPYAALSLGRLHFFGSGVPQNDEKALYWVGSAACYGLPQAKSFLELIRQHPGGVIEPTTPANTNSPGTTVAQDLRAYKTCLQQHQDETSKCDAIEKAYKADLELLRAVLGR